MSNELTTPTQERTDERAVTVPELWKRAHGDGPRWKRRLYRLLVELLQDRGTAAGPMI